MNFVFLGFVGLNFKIVVFGSDIFRKILGDLVFMWVDSF